MIRGADTLARRFGGVPQHGRLLGSPNAPYTLVLFADLQCPFCAAFDRDVLPTVIDRYVRSAKLRIDLRVIAFLGPDSATAAAVAAASGLQDHLWEFADLIYRNQGRENSGYVTPAYLGVITRAIPGLDRERLEEASGTAAVRAVLAADARAARTAGITGTPGIRFGRTGGVLTAPTTGPVRRDAFLRRLAAAIR